MISALGKLMLEKEEGRRGGEGEGGRERESIGKWKDREANSNTHCLDCNNHLIIFRLYPTGSAKVT